MSDQKQPATGGIVHVAHEPKGCDVWIPGAPKSIPRARVLELIESLGIDPKETRSLRFEPEAVHVEVYALRDGSRYWGGSSDKLAARHWIVIPIADQLDTAEVGRSVVEAVKAYENRGDGTSPSPQPA